MSTTENKPTFTPKKVVQTIGNLTISEYSMTVPSYVNKKTGEVVPERKSDLVELVTTKKKWSDEISAFYDQRAFITLTSETMGELVQFLTSKK